MKGTGAKRNVCPGSCVSTGATFPVVPVESAPTQTRSKQVCIQLRRRPTLTTCHYICIRPPRCCELRRSNRFISSAGRATAANSAAMAHAGTGQTGKLIDSAPHSLGLYVLRAVQIIRPFRRVTNLCKLIMTKHCLIRARHCLNLWSLLPASSGAGST